MLRVGSVGSDTQRRPETWGDQAQTLSFIQTGYSDIKSGSKLRGKEKSFPSIWEKVRAPTAWVLLVQPLPTAATILQGGHYEGSTSKSK